MRDLVKPVLYLPDNNTAYTVLAKFKESKIHYALIVDEYGRTQGMVTINDILEALVGEFDELNMPGYSIIPREDGSFLVDAALPFYDFIKYFEMEDEFEMLDELEYNTLAGFILHQMERIPEEGEKLDWKQYEFEIVDMDSTRIDKVLFMKNNNTALLVDTTHNIEMKLIADSGSTKTDWILIDGSNNIVTTFSTKD